MPVAQRRPRQPRGAGLGTFAGVFTPSVLTILGLVLFRRLGYVVGGSGLLLALAIIGLSVSISVLTSLSLAATATNMRVRGGGVYYLISRSLGVEFGGAIGIVLYLAQSISVAFYCVGLGEAVAELYPGGWLSDPRWVALGAAVFLFTFAWAGADVATRLQYVIMAVLGGAILSFFAGGLAAFTVDTVRANAGGGAPGSPGFWTLFAIFFPAVTGFTQGVNMSGDLKDPGKSLPWGTLYAVGVSTVIYVGAAIVFAGALPGSVLVADYDSMSQVATVPALIMAGLIGATLSSALTSYLGAPRILQALAADDVLPVLRPFARGHGPHNNPRRGILGSFVIGAVFIFLGGINFIAPIVSMFFLISYGLLNYATAFEARANSPSFRPRFRWFHYRASLAGALACLGAMVMIDALATAVAIAILVAIQQYIDRLRRPERWSDSKRDHYFQQMRQDLLALARELEHPRNWRPRILVFSDTPKRRGLLLRFAAWIEGKAGLTTVVKIVEERRERLQKELEAEREAIQKDIDELQVEAFPLVVAAPDTRTAVQTVLQSAGIGPLRVNVALLNWLEQRRLGQTPEDPERRAVRLQYARALAATVRIGVSVVVFDAKEDEWAAMERAPAAERRIDIWWENDPSSRLMLLLAYLMTRSPDWEDATIRVLSPAQALGPSQALAERRVESWLEATLEALRIEAETEAVEAWHPESLVEKSRDASLVFLPLRLRRGMIVDPFGQPVERLLDQLPLVALVLAAEDIDLEADPENGQSPAAEAVGAGEARGAAASAPDAEAPGEPAAG